MGIFDYKLEDVLGTVESVDTSTIVVRVENDDSLRSLQVNHLVVVRSIKTNQHLLMLIKASIYLELSLLVRILERLELKKMYFAEHCQQCQR